MTKRNIKSVIFKLLVIVAVIAVLGVAMWLTMKALGVTSLEGLRAITNRYGMWTYLIVGIIEYLQTILLPISSAIILGFAVACVGTWQSFFVSWIAISAGAITLHLIGRLGGKKLLNWVLSDKEQTVKLQAMMKERKLFFIVGMLNPIIPDEILATLSGVCKMNFLYVVIVAIVTRGICIFFEVFAFDILFSHWWGIMLVVLFFVVMITLSVITIKYGDKIEKWLFSLFKKEVTMTNCPDEVAPALKCTHCKHCDGTERRCSQPEAMSYKAGVTDTCYAFQEVDDDT